MEGRKDKVSTTSHVSAELPFLAERFLVDSFVVFMHLSIII
jgi:hypothetical protein